MDHDLRQEIKNFLISALKFKASRRCEICDKVMDHLMVTFIYDGKTWDVPLPVCSNCEGGGQNTEKARAA
jgi:hypothetical protein